MLLADILFLQQESLNNLTNNIQTLHYNIIFNITNVNFYIKFDQQLS